MITYNNYLEQFNEILDGNSFDSIYEDPTFLQYVKLNASRMKRWKKVGELSEETIAEITTISKPQTWVVITEPWCGDAAHIVPFIHKMAEANDQIKLVIQNRDNGSEIDKYLTNGARSIPKLIVRDELGNDLFNWGPRPAPAQELHLELKDNHILNSSEKKEQLQLWYNKDQGKVIQEEICQLLKSI